MKEFMSKFCQPVTCLFDIGRKDIDGRSIDQYLPWLRQTLEIFPELIVYHDGSCRDIATNNFIEIDKSEYISAEYIDAVSIVISQMSPSAKEDITFKTPLYSLVQYSKFSLLNKAKELTKAKSYLWVDAGISRFLTNDNTKKLLQINSETAISSGLEFIFEIDLRRNFDFSKLSIKKAVPGTCKRIFSGTSFWVQSSRVTDLHIAVNQRMKEWINLGIWDNEQVLLRSIMPFSDSIEYVLQRNLPTGSVARNLLSENFRVHKFRNNLIRNALSR
jgi:hypothetical protein